MMRCSNHLLFQTPALLPDGRYFVARQAKHGAHDWRRPLRRPGVSLGVRNAAAVEASAADMPVLGVPPVFSALESAKCLNDCLHGAASAEELLATYANARERVTRINACTAYNRLSQVRWVTVQPIVPGCACLRALQRPGDDLKDTVRGTSVAVARRVAVPRRAWKPAVSPTPLAGVNG